MMKKSLLSAGSILMAALVAWNSVGIPAASAQFVNTSACLTQAYNALAHEKRLYRSVLFGQKESKDLPNGSVRYDKEGNAWIKKADNSWASYAKGYEQTKWFDGQMDDQADVPKRRGIFEATKTPTTDLIPAVTQAMRAYQCRLLSVCESALFSQSAGPNQTTLTTQPQGCIELEQPVLTSCNQNEQATAGATSCTDVVHAMLQEEQQQLILLIAYDASVRSLYQFAGIFDGFLKDVRFPLIEPLWQAVRALGSLSGLPCFIGQCDE